MYTARQPLVADRSASQTSHYHYRTTTRHKYQQNDYGDYGRDKECPAGRQRTGKGRRRHRSRDQQQTDGEQRQETGGGGEGRQGSDARRSCRTTAAEVHREEAELRKGRRVPVSVLAHSRHPVHVTVLPQGGDMAQAGWTQIRGKYPLHLPVNYIVH